MTYATISIPEEIKQRFQLAAQARGFKTDAAAATEAIEAWIGDPKKAAEQAANILNPRKVIKSRHN